MNFVFILHSCATFFMCGLIWFVQIVHYPLFSSVATEKFTKYEKLNMRLTTRVVVPPMIIELVTGCTLLWKRPDFLPEVFLWSSLLLLAVVWLSTAILQAPKHNLLALGFNKKIHRSLVLTNWIRTAGWTCRSLLWVYVLKDTAIV